MERSDTTEESHDAIVLELLRACLVADETYVSRLLDPVVILLIDGGGKVCAPTQPVVGPQQAAEVLIRLATAPDMVVGPWPVNGRRGLVFRHMDRVVGVLGLDAMSGLIREIWIVVNPEKLRRWNP